MKPLKRRTLGIALGLVLLGGVAVVGPKVFRVASNWGATLIEVHHCPSTFSRRAGDFTANICGHLGANARERRYRLNGGEWVPLKRRYPRITAPDFTIELAADELQPGTNRLEISATRYYLEEEVLAREFEYDPAPILLPLLEDWSEPDLDVQDGHWETIVVEGVRRVRPVPGEEGYDRVIVVTGAFAGGRRIETDVIFRGDIGHEMYGFGVLPLWGGRPDRDGARPRRGWSFSLVWYYSHYEGVGQEFSYRDSAASPAWVSLYRNIDLPPDSRHFIVVECRPVTGPDGSHRHYSQRMKWWLEGEDEPEEWMELQDAEGAPLPPGEYAVALVAHRSQVEFGPVEVTALEDE